MSGAPVAETISSVMDPHTAALFLEIARGPHGQDYLSIAQAVDIFSRYGVIFLLFHVGLNTCVAELRQVGGNAIRVALIGVLLPFTMGFIVTWLITPEAPHTMHMFLGATLGATSIGITARVLQDLNKENSRESHVILGAAVMDDVLGLVMLSIVSGIVVTGSMQFNSILQTIFLAALFITSTLLLGPYIIRLLTRLLAKLDVMEAKLFISFVFVMLLAWFANLAGLATIIGAFAAGLLLHEKHFIAWGRRHDQKYTIQELFAPLESILAPIFFVLMGIQVKLETFLDWDVIFLASGLLIAAIAGKVAAGAGAEKRLNRLSIGLGMMPRGEVGLVFASIGKTLGVINSAMFSAVVLMVIITTLSTPPLLKLAMKRGTHEGVDRRHKRIKLCE
ncbi:MAG: cation:proton antiporter [Pseudomonadota bacterium]